MSNKKWLMILIFMTITSFILGYQLKTFLYTDACLDMGGGMNPDGYGICVVREPATP